MNDKIIKVSDLLEQVDELNRMIEIHEDASNEASMFSQYNNMKGEYINELNSILQSFQLSIKAV